MQIINDIDNLLGKCVTKDLIANGHVIIEQREVFSLAAQGAVVFATVIRASKNGGVAAALQNQIPRGAYFGTWGDPRNKFVISKHWAHGPARTRSSLIERKQDRSSCIGSNFPFNLSLIHI